jgi:6-phosphofructokinase 1
MAHLAHIVLIRAFFCRKVTAAIVTCGGICPGVNTVVRELVCCLETLYGVSKVWGVPFGYEGFYRGFENSNFKNSGFLRLTASVVDQIHLQGGSFLGTSRGGHDTNKIVDSLVKGNINMVFVVGGDGTLRGGSVIADEINRRGLNIAVVGVPKTIDNDIPVIDKVG